MEPIKICIVFTLLLLSFQKSEATLTEKEMKDAMMVLRVACITKFNVTEKELTDLNNDYYIDNVEGDLKCYVNCILESFGLMKKGKMNYNFTVKRIKTFIPLELQETFIKGLDGCRDVGPNMELCEKSYATFICMHRINPHFDMP